MDLSQALPPSRAMAGLVQDPGRRRAYKMFDLLEDALAFVSTGARRTHKGGGDAIGEVLEKSLASRAADLKPSSIRTVRFRLEAIFQGRRAIPVEAFPWVKAWTEHAVV